MVRRNPIVPLLVITLLCTGLVEAGYLALEYFVLRQGERLRQAAPVAGQTDDVGTTQALNHDYRLILQRNLFRGAVAQEVPAETPDEESSEDQALVQLNIVLMGTVGGDVPRAFILDKTTNRQQVFEVGDAVGGGIISEIQRGKITLSVDNRDQVLDLTEAAKLRPTLPKDGAPEPVPQEMLPQAVAPPMDGPPPGPESAAVTGQTPQTRLVRLPRPGDQPVAENGVTVQE